MRAMYWRERLSCCSGGRSTSRGASTAAVVAPNKLVAWAPSTLPVRAAATPKTPSVIAPAASNPVNLFKRIGKSLPRQRRSKTAASIGEPDLVCQRDRSDEKPFGFSTIGAGPAGHTQPPPMHPNGDAFTEKHRPESQQN